MASTHINHLKDYFERVDRFRQRPNALTVGDSWFQYPLRLYPDLQTRLASDKRFGRRVNFLDDSYPGRDAKDIRTMVRAWRDVGAVLADRGRPFSLILLSLGGNDVIGRDFARHLTDGAGRDGRAWPFSAKVPAVARRWIDLGALRATFEQVAASYRLMIGLRDAVAPGARILAHTYAAVTPMDKPYKFLKMRSGPWIWKPATKAGVPFEDQRVLVAWLLESFHGLLSSVRDGTTGRTVLDTRLELADPAGWDNEIHPLGPGFVHLADTFWTPAVDEAIG